ncbi:MAG: hypothetical protein ACREJN_12465 [Nitrospiraceae bacterium]
MRRFTVVAMGLLFVFVGVQPFAQAEEKQGKMVETKGEANAKAEVDREIKVIGEEVKSNEVKDSIERGAQGKPKAAEGRVEDMVKQQTPKAE